MIDILSPEKVAELYGFAGRPWATRNLADSHEALRARLADTEKERDKLQASFNELAPGAGSAARGAPATPGKGRGCLTGGATVTGLSTFVRESNRIEGITRAPTRGEIEAHLFILGQDELTVTDLSLFVSQVARANIRDAVGMDVRVGNHLPPRGGPFIEDVLADLLVAASTRRATPYEVHVAYETLHPFMDGNGRSGRALWAWQMQREGHDPFALPFLHRFYYQTLDATQDRRPAAGDSGEREVVLRALLNDAEAERDRLRNQLATLLDVIPEVIGKRLKEAHSAWLDGRGSDWTQERFMAEVRAVLEARITPDVPPTARDSGGREPDPNQVAEEQQ